MTFAPSIGFLCSVMTLNPLRPDACTDEVGCVWLKMNFVMVPVAEIEHSRSDAFD